MTKVSSTVHVDKVVKRFGNHTALHETSLTIERGTFMALLGPSGCGKSTLLNMIAGFLTPSAGDIFFDSTKVTETPPYRRRVGMVFQNYALFPHMTVFENLAYGLKMQKASRATVESEVHRILDVIKLSQFADRYPRQLSGGQQQRVAIGRAVIINPHVLLLDEPLSALDKNLRANMQVEIKDIQSRLGITTVFVTHDQGEALSLADSLAVMSEGHIRQLGKPTEIYERPADPFVASFLGDITRLKANVESRHRNDLRLAVDQGHLTLPKVKLKAANVGDICSVFIRPEHFFIVPEGEKAPINGKVSAYVYQGSHVDLYVRNASAESGVILLRLSDTSAAQRWPVGSQVGIGYQSDKVHVFSGETAL
jgi:spermidine/putrescine ABC transporter ATP-binding subunit